MTSPKVIQADDQVDASPIHTFSFCLEVWYQLFPMAESGRQKLSYNHRPERRTNCTPSTKQSKISKGLNMNNRRWNLRKMTYKVPHNPNGVEPFLGSLLMDRYPSIASRVIHVQSLWDCQLPANIQDSRPSGNWSHLSQSKCNLSCTRFAELSDCERSGVLKLAFVWNVACGFQMCDRK